MNPDKIYLTQEKLEELKLELTELSTTGRTAIAEQLDSAKAMGDLKENAEYHQTREDQAIMEERIGHLMHVVKHAQIITDEQHSCVEIGATVVIARKGSPTKQEFIIVGTEESDPSAGKLSFDSPLVMAMISKTEGDFFNFDTPDGDKVEWKVISVR